MIPAHAMMLCPLCRVFVDLLGSSMSPSTLIRCPWCQGSSTAERYASAADRETCPTCSHPTAAHVAWITPDGEPPHPQNRSHCRPIAAPCVFCARAGNSNPCEALDGAREVRA